MNTLAFFTVILGERCLANQVSAKTTKVIAVHVKVLLFVSARSYARGRVARMLA